MVKVMAAPGRGPVGAPARGGRKGRFPRRESQWKDLVFSNKELGRRKASLMV